MTEIERLRRQLAVQSLRAELSPHVDKDYAAVIAERHRDRVKLDDDGTPVPSSVASITAEIVKAADARWRLDGGEAGPKTFYDTVRARLKAQREREEQERKARVRDLNQKFGG
jgi:hypothetical protein